MNKVYMKHIYEIIDDFSNYMYLMTFNILWTLHKGYNTFRKLKLLNGESLYQRVFETHSV